MPVEEDAKSGDEYFNYCKNLNIPNPPPFYYAYLGPEPWLLSKQQSAKLTRLHDQKIRNELFRKHLQALRRCPHLAPRMTRAALIKL